ncbi:hypothetical protein HTG_11280 [Natrinema mahii]|nr:hypothetical protein HTG_11280 [Natrinema mahii]
MVDISKSSIIIWLKEPEWGAIALLISLGAIITGIFSSFHILVDTLLVITGGAAIIGWAWVTFWLSGIRVTCLQTEPITSAEAQHKHVHFFPDGYAEFEVYIGVPEWVSRFSIEIHHDGPFDFQPWDLPAPVSFRNGVIHVEGDLDEVPFVLRFGGEPEEIGDATYRVIFKEKDSEKTLHTMSLNGDRMVKTDSDIEDVDQEITEELGISVSE